MLAIVVRILGFITQLLSNLFRMLGWGAAVIIVATEQAETEGEVREPESAEPRLVAYGPRRERGPPPQQNKPQRRRYKKKKPRQRSVVGRNPWQRYHNKRQRRKGQRPREHHKSR